MIRRPLRPLARVLTALYFVGVYFVGVIAGLLAFGFGRR